MLFDAGLCKIYELIDTAAAGDMPQPKLRLHSELFYGERTIGFSRQYSAMSVNEQVDLLIRIWGDKSIKIGMYAIPEDGEQYRISMVQHLKDDEDGLLVTDLTLTRLENYYEFDTED